jgi:hypothetical protein
MGMPADWIVKHFNIVKDIGSCYISGFVNSFFDTLFFQTAKKGFGYSIIPAVAAPTHTRLEIVVATKPSPVVAAILGTLIGVYDYEITRLMPPHCHD